MAAPTKGKHWQKQADHFQSVINDMEDTRADANSTPEEIAEAEQTITDMQANLARLSEKHGVTPGGVPPPSTT